MSERHCDECGKLYHFKPFSSLKRPKGPHNSHFIFENIIPCSGQFKKECQVLSKMIYLWSGLDCYFQDLPLRSRISQNIQECMAVADCNALDYSAIRAGPSRKERWLLLIAIHEQC